MHGGHRAYGVAITASRALRNTHPVVYKYQTEYLILSLSFPSLSFQIIFTLPSLTIHLTQLSTSLNMKLHAIILASLVSLSLANPIAQPEMAELDKRGHGGATITRTITRTHMWHHSKTTQTITETVTLTNTATTTKSPKTKPTTQPAQTVTVTKTTGKLKPTNPATKCPSQPLLICTPELLGCDCVRDVR